MNIINLTDFSKGSFRKQIFYPLNRVKLNVESFSIYAGFKVNMVEIHL